MDMREPFWHVQRGRKWKGREGEAALCLAYPRQLLKGQSDRLAPFAAWRAGLYVKDRSTVWRAPATLPCRIERSATGGALSGQPDRHFYEAAMTSAAASHCPAI